MWAQFGTSRFMVETVFWNQFRWSMAEAMRIASQATANAKTRATATTFGDSTVTTILGLRLLQA